jgi:hypothetical protein
MIPTNSRRGSPPVETQDPGKEIKQMSIVIDPVVDLEAELARVESAYKAVIEKLARGESVPPIELREALHAAGKKSDDVKADLLEARVIHADEQAHKESERLQGAPMHEALDALHKAGAQFDLIRAIVPRVANTLAAAADMEIGKVNQHIYSIRGASDRLRKSPNQSDVKGRKLNIEMLKKELEFDKAAIAACDDLQVLRVKELQLNQKLREISELETGEPSLMTSIPIGPAPQVRNLLAELPALLGKILADLKIENAKEKLHDLGAALLAVADET